MDKKLLQKVEDIVREHHAGRIPVYMPGQYHNYVRSQSASCWSDTLEIDGLSISFCTPSPLYKDEGLVALYDFIEKEAGQ